MERIPRGPQENWPVKLQYGWPACGKLYAHRPIFEDFLVCADQGLPQALEHRMQTQRMVALSTLKLRAAKTVSSLLAGVTGAGGDAAPVNLLVCFGTEFPCEFMGG